MRYNPINNCIMAVQKYAGGYGGYGCDALSTSTKVLLRRDCALSTKVLEVLEGCAEGARRLC